MMFTGKDVIKLGESEYHLASARHGGGEKKSEAKLVGRMISEQLREVFIDDFDNTYISPDDSSSVPPCHVPSPRLGNISYNTLTRVVREELRRFRAEASWYSQHQSGGSSRRREDGDHEEIDEKYAHITARSMPQYQAPQPPPLHVRRDATPTSPATDHVNRRPTVTGPDSAVVTAEMVSDSVRRRRMLVNDQSVIRLLERIEQSSAELDASFTALVEDGLRCPGDWQRLARELPICKPDKLSRRIALIESRYRDDVKGQAAAALAEWRSYRRNKATLRELMAALKRCDLLKDADFLNSMSQKSAN